MIILSPIVFLLAFAALAWLTSRVAQKRTIGRALGVSLLWPWLWTAPAVCVQALRMGDDGLENLLFFFLSWVVQVGGHSVTLLFEANVGDRQSTLADQFDFYLYFWTAQLALAVLLGTLRFRMVGRLRDKWMVLLGVALGVNALLNINWPWWGT